MSTKDRAGASGTSFDFETAVEAVRRDTEGVLGAFLKGEFEVDRTIGAATWRSATSQLFAVRWRFSGRHTGAIPGFGHVEIRATGNEVTVSGLTLVELRQPVDSVDDLDAVLTSGAVVFHRFIDWLAVFAQIGVLHLGRPMSLGDVKLVPPESAFSRRPGYNDESE
jgi:hypothetical protein